MSPSRVPRKHNRVVAGASCMTQSCEFCAVLAPATARWVGLNMLHALAGKIRTPPLLDGRVVTWQESKCTTVGYDSKRNNVYE